MIDLVQETLDADARIRPHVRETPVEESIVLSRLAGASVALKLEGYQRTGSFKVRGAMNKLLSLAAEERDRGVVAASSGNHGAAVAYGVRALGTRGVIFVPEDASPTKVEAIEALGAAVRREGADCVVSEALARRYAAEHGLTYLSPYNDPLVIAGQGTLGVELARQLEAVDTVYMALGGGGLTSGVAGYLKSLDERTQIVACSPRRSKVMHESIRAGQILDLESQPTLSDGTAGGVEAGSITFELCRRLVDRYLVVTEDEIREAMRIVIGHHHVLVEGAAGVAVAGFLQEKEQLRGRRIAIVLCGANIALDTLRQVL